MYIYIYIYIFVVCCIYMFLLPTNQRVPYKSKFEHSVSWVTSNQSYFAPWWTCWARFGLLVPPYTMCSSAWVTKRSMMALVITGREGREGRTHILSFDYMYFFWLYTYIYYIYLYYICYIYYIYYDLICFITKVLNIIHKQ